MAAIFIFSKKTVGGLPKLSRTCSSALHGCGNWYAALESLDHLSTGPLGQEKVLP